MSACAETANAWKRQWFGRRRGGTPDYFATALVQVIYASA